MNTPHRAALAVLATLVLGGCGSDAAAPGAGGTPASPSSTPGEPTVTEQPTQRDRQTRQAVTDLMERLSVPESDVRVVAAEEVTWRDGALGCPKKDRMYTMALVEGRRIVLEVDGKRYAYHAGGDKPPFYCEQPESPAPGGAS